jgi:uncharacterized membrane protein YjjP (DUF1212 family)
MAYEQEDRDEQERRFEKLEESIHKNYRLVIAIGVGIVTGCFVFALGASLKASAWAVLAGVLCVEIESIYEAKRRKR